ncbi:MAG: T9SS type A sorting domain-containing protein [Flavobacteriales bacterium]|nr:T9SS type A sorting domain-containing protein [Flavobacteriales bacterium]
MRTVFSTLLLSFISILSFAQVIRVPIDQPTIQQGLNAAIFGDTVLIAPGTYFENITWPSVNGIKLIAEGDTSNTFVDGSGAERVIYIQGHTIDTLTLIEGLTIQNGRGVGTLSGSGIFCDSSSVSINKCRVRRNKGVVGVGICLNNSSTIIRNSTIKENYGRGSQIGGIGIFIFDFSDVKIYSSQIVENLADTCVKVLGAGIYISKHSDLNIYDSDVSRNTGIVGFTYGESRGVGIFGFFSSNISMYNCKVNDNQLLTQGEYSLGTAINVEQDTDIHLENTEMNGNISESTSYSMVGIFSVREGFCSLKGVTISNNTMNFQSSSTLNSGLVNVYGNFNAENLIIRDNFVTASDENALLNSSILSCQGYYLGRSFLLKNSLIVRNNSNVQQIGESTNGLINLSNVVDALILNSTIADNLSSTNPANGKRVVQLDTSSLNVINTILHNPHLQSEIEGTNVSVEYSDVKGGYQGTGNIGADPMFIGNGDYRLQTFSPCINSGTLVGAPLTDIEGNPRPLPIGTNPDMGAYEDDNPSTSIHENESKNAFGIYPNPSSGEVRLNTQLQQLESIQIYNMHGQLVFELKNPNSTLLNLRAFPNGLYSVLVQLNNGDIQISKLVLTK